MGVQAHLESTKSTLGDAFHGACVFLQLEFPRIGHDQKGRRAVGFVSGATAARNRAAVNLQRGTGKPRIRSAGAIEVVSGVIFAQRIPAVS